MCVCCPIASWETSENMKMKMCFLLIGGNLSSKALVFFSLFSINFSHSNSLNKSLWRHRRSCRTDTTHLFCLINTLFIAHRRFVLITFSHWVLVDRCLIDKWMNWEWHNQSRFYNVTSVNRWGMKLKSWLDKG